MLLSYFQRSQSAGRITTIRQKKIDSFSVDGLCGHCNTVFETMGCYYLFCLYQRVGPSSIDSECERGRKTRQQGEMRWDYMQQKYTNFFYM